MDELIGRRITLTDGPYEGEIVEVVEVDGEHAIARPIDVSLGFAKVMIPIAEIEREDDEALEQREF